VVETGGGWIVAGLGNPGPQYAGTRHDLGFALVTRLADEAGLSFAAGPGIEIAGPVQWNGGAALLVRPQLYMNRSGPPLQQLLETAGLPAERLLVACDDVNLPLGRLRLRPQGSAGGHNGLRSVIGSLGECFPRLRMGVGSGPEDVVQTDWVLGHFEESERESVRDMLDRAAGLVRDAVASGTVTSATSDPTPTEEPGQDREEAGKDDE
jgi:PTH1 family peptidyl-tRNA hydrolase